MNARSTRTGLRDEDSYSSSSLSSGRLEGSSSHTDDNSGSEPPEAADDTMDEEVKRVHQQTEIESWRIKLWRFIVIASLLIAGGAVSAFTLSFLRSQENENFVSAYFLFTNTVRDTTVFRSRNLFQAFRRLGETFSAYEQTSNETFPFITLPNFEIKGSHARSRSGVETIQYLPIVPGYLKPEWELYAAENYDHWVAESRTTVVAKGVLTPSEFLPGSISPEIMEFSSDGSGEIVPAPPGKSSYTPTWLTSPPPYSPAIENLDFVTVHDVESEFSALQVVRDVVLSNFVNVSVSRGLGYAGEDHDEFHSLFTATGLEEEDVVASDLRPHALVISPVFSQLGNKSSAVTGIFIGQLAFDVYLQNLLPDAVSGIQAVVENSCSEAHTYEIEGSQAVYKGIGDLHDREYDDKPVTIDFSDYSDPDLAKSVEGHCFYNIVLYPTDDFKSQYESDVPIVFTCVVAGTFALMILIFFGYDRIVDRRNDKVVDTAARASTIVSSLFPSNVRDRLYADAAGKQTGNHSRLKSFLKEGVSGDDDREEMIDHGVSVYKTKPIAELFPETTVMFGDITGFTAWASSREPAQVFVLLETVYHAFDEIANKRGVFKVETVGDCYVAVTGLPDPRRDHAVVMVRFARECLHKMQNLVKSLEVSLGPDTAELSMRVGIHSGPVTAGVLRGERSRFQLFGDTMNTASRMESNGAEGKIQISEETMQLLVAAGKQGWFVPREEKIMAKGKGELSTFWLTLGSDPSQIHSSKGSGLDASSDLPGEDSNMKSEAIASLSNGKISRLVEWNVDVLTRLLKQIVAKNRVLNNPVEIPRNAPGWYRDISNGQTLLDEVQETITLPPYFSDIGRLQEEADRVELDDLVKAQLREYVSNVAAMYHDNPFHNYEHASHVAMSVVKLLSRIVAPGDVLDRKTEGGNDKKGTAITSQLHVYTYGITSDPLTQFACVMCALIHDVDHPGVPNSQLIKENSKIASFYKNKSVAEQNSVDLAWDMLQDSSFSELRSTIHQTKEKFVRFRQVVVNTVMATDIMDRDLKALRNARWERAFSEKSVNDPDNMNRKATIVIEHLMQASDVVHTMQHWHVYRKWNERLFFEIYEAYIKGRCEKDPSISWYEGEIGFFDFYIIPLAKKLKECGVFGVSSDEYLNYAKKNRQEWVARGREVVQEMIESVRARYGENPALPTGTGATKSPLTTVASSA